jgi:hypothetical protein
VVPAAEKERDLMAALFTRARCLTLVFSVGTVVAVVSPVTAQSKWEVEAHGGGVSLTNPTTGPTSLPAPGEAFTTAGIYPPPAPQVVVVSTSRRISSWYFGDGALLFNQAAAAVAANPVAMTSAFPGRIVALDPVLGRPLGAARRGGAFGLRLARLVTPRLSVELNVDYSVARRQLTQANSDAIEATRASFIAAFNGLITSNPNRVLNSLTSTAAVSNGTGGELFTTGTLLINLRTTGSLIPFATAGAGVLATTGTTPSVTLTGNYRFLNPSGSPINETDTVTVSEGRDRRTVAGVVGGGVKYHVSPRWGIRVDARVFLSKNTATTLLDASPNVLLGQLPIGRGTLNTDPTIQFSNNWTDPITTLGVTSVARSTLSGPVVTDFRTWSGNGLSSRTHVVAGMFWRF